MAADFAVGPQIAGLCKRAHANAALEWFLTRVPPNVNLKRAAPHERLLTKLALERPLTSMPTVMVA